MDDNNEEIKARKLEANFSTLVLSIGSSAAMALGLAPDPSTGKTSQDFALAQFNIDLLIMLQNKTRANLNEEEAQFLNHVISDLQIKFVENKK